jgi:integrase
MPKVAFTDLKVQSLAPGVYFDAKTPGFGIRVGANRKTWIVLKGAKSIKVRLGHYPALSLAEARRHALVALGTPFQPSLAPAFSDARTMFLEEHASKLRPRSRIELTRTLTKHFTWAKPLDKITANDVATAVAAIERPSEANHAFKDIRTFFNWCVPRFLKYSPCTGLKMPHKAETRDRVLSDHELRAIWLAAEQCGTPGTIIKLLMLTGQRKTEISSLRAEWIVEDTITLPAEITKNKRRHAFPIGPLTRSVLDPLVKCGTGLLFPARGHTNKAFNGWGASKESIDQLANIPAWTIHDLRRSLCTKWAEDLRIAPHLIERYVNHVSGQVSGVAAIYNRARHIEELGECVENWEAHLATILDKT